MSATLRARSVRSACVSAVSLPHGLKPGSSATLAVKVLITGKAETHR